MGQTWIACRWLIKHGHKALELSLRQTEVASIKQYDFRFPACRLQHEIGAVPAEGLRGPVYKILLATAHPQVNGGASGLIRLRCGCRHDRLPFVYTSNIRYCRYNVNTCCSWDIVSRQKIQSSCHV